MLHLTLKKISSSASSVAISGMPVIRRTFPLRQSHGKTGRSGKCPIGNLSAVLALLIITFSTERKINLLNIRFDDSESIVVTIAFYDNRTVSLAFQICAFLAYVSLDLLASLARSLQVKLLRFSCCCGGVSWGESAIKSQHLTFHSLNPRTHS